MPRAAAPRSHHHGALALKRKPGTAHGGIGICRAVEGGEGTRRGTEASGPSAIRQLRHLAEESAIGRLDVEALKMRPHVSTASIWIGMIASTKMPAQGGRGDIEMAITTIEQAAHVQDEVRKLVERLVQEGYSVSDAMVGVLTGAAGVMSATSSPGTAADFLEGLAKSIRAQGAAAAN